MTTILDEFKPVALIGRTPKYPWDDWTTGQPMEIEKGVDYHCSSRSMKDALYSHARRHGYTVRVSCGQESVRFQFSKDQP